MNVDEIVRQLKAERTRLEAAIQALEGTGGLGLKRRGRPPGNVNKPTPPHRRGMSAAARRRIAEATKARWAAAKTSGKKRL
jgi:hypothetical protein